MTTFIYLGGVENDGEPLPFAIQAFGHRFVENEPVTIDPSLFKSGRDHDHAVMKLSGHPLFQKLKDGVQEVIQARKKPGRKPKAEAVVEDAEVITDAAE
jgi:hypothetical protein